MNDQDRLGQFARHYHLVRAARKAMTAPQLSLSVRFQVGAPITAGLQAPPRPEINRVASLLGPFIEPSSDLHYARVAASLIARLPAGATEERTAIEQRGIALQSPKPFVILNDHPLTMEDLYFAYAQGEFFRDDEDAIAVLRQIQGMPGGDELLRFNFYAYSDDVFRFADLMYMILRSAKLHQLSPSQAVVRAALGPCVYCLTTEGKFSAVEHVYSEALGNTEIILPVGAVCDSCNHGTLSTLDDYLINHDCVAFLRTVFIQHNPKTGKFPKAKGQDFTISKVGPRHLEISMHSGAPHPVEKPRDDGQVDVKLQVTGRARFNPKMLARALFKVGLGFVAWKEGSDFARDKRYNEAREFILGRRDTFPNHLAIQTKCTPVPEIQSTMQVLTVGTPVELNLYGVRFFFNLEPTPEMAVDQVPVDWVTHPLFDPRNTEAA